MEKILQRFLLLLLLLPLSVLSFAQNYAEVLPGNSNVLKTDKVSGSETLSSITLEVTLAAGTQPNGQAQLRTSTDENKLVNTGTNELKDDVLVQKSTDPNVWEITWLNVPVGDYKIYFQQQSGTGHTFLHDVTIKEIPANLVPKLTVETTPSYCDAKAGTAMLQVKDGTAPYSCTAVITRADGKTETVTKTITDNSWTIEGLAATEYVTFRVTDQGGQTVTTKSDVIANTSVEVKNNGYLYVFQNGQNGLCSFDYYVYVNIKTSSAEAAKKQTEMLAQSMRLKKYEIHGEGAIYKLEYDPSLDKNYSSSYYRYFKIPSSANLAVSERFGLSYDKLCGGTVKANTYQYELRNLADMTNIYPSADGSLCDAEDGTYKLTYNFLGKNNDWTNTYYVFLDANKYGRILKESNGSYEVVNDKVLMPAEKFPSMPFFNSIPLPGPGKYKFEYGSETDCSQTYFSKEFEVKLPSLSINGGKAPTAKQCYTVYGNTAGIEFQVKNTGFPFTVEVSRPDNKSSFEVADFLTKNTYTKQIQFPVKVTYQKEQYLYVIGDLPEGDYVMKVKDACGQEAEQAFSIKDTDLQHYNPKNDEGYKDGVYVGIDCNGNNIVKMNYGPSCNNLAVASYRYNKNTGSHTSGHSPYDYTNGYKEDNLLKDNAFSVSFNQWIRKLDGHRSSDFPYYSAIEKVDTVFNYANQKGDREGNWATKAYKFNFEDITGADATAFEVFGAMCKKDEPSSGMIAVGVKKGVNYTGTLSYELFTTADGTTPGTKVKDNSDLKNNVWTNVQEGKYLVKISYGDGCDTKKFVEVKAADIPLPGVETDIVDKYEYNDPIYVDITKNDKPLHLILPVSPYIYHVEWVDITDPAHEVSKGTGNEIYATFTKPGTYTYEIRTTFTENTSCKGNSGGTRKVTFIVKGPNYWLGKTDENFSDKTNWTENRVPEENEDIIFATVENYGTAAINDCRLVNGAESLNFVAGKLENQSAKAMVIPAGSGLKVTNMVGFEHKTGEPVRLKIEAEAGKPNGAFVYAGAPSDAKVFAEVQMNVKSTKLPTPTTWKDNVQGSPTFGENLPVAFTDQFFGIPFQKTSSAWLGGSYIYKYDEATNASNKFYQKFTGLKAKEMMTAFAGYSIRSTAAEAKVKSMKGYLNLSDATLTLTRKASKVADAKAASDAINHWGLGQNLFGNSYTAPMKISGLTLPDALDNTIYMYNTGSGKDWGDATSQSGTSAGTYLAVPVNTASQQGVNEIPSMQGFLLKFTEGETTVNGADVKVGLKYDNLVTNAEQGQMAKGYTFGTNTQPGVVRFILNGEDVSDVMWLFEQPGTSDNFDNGWDGQKLGAEMMSSMIYSDSKAGKLQVNTTDDLTKANITIVTAKPGRYVLNLSRKDLPQYSDLKLIDSKVKMIVPFEGDALEYEFDVTGNGVLGDRFKLVNTTATSFGNLPTEIQGVTTATWNGPAVVYTVSGERVANVRQPEDLNRLKAQLPNGVYIVSMQVDGKTVSQKMVITK